MPPKPVTADHFLHYRFATALKGGPGGNLCWVQKQARLETNSTSADLWTLHKGVPLRLTAGCEVEDFWWLGDVVVFAALREQADRQRRSAGFPLTVLYTISTVLPGEAVEWLRLDYDICDIAFLPGGRFLFTAAFDARREALLAEAASDAEAAKALEAEGEARVLTELPFWAEGEGFTSGRRNRLYLYDDGRVTPISDALTGVEQLRLSPSGAAAFFVAARHEARGSFKNSLVRLDLATLTLKNISFKANFIHTGFVVHDDDTLLVYGTDGAAYGLNQNCSFYRVDLAARAVRTLETGGRFCTWNAIVGDLDLHAEPRPAESAAGAYWIDTLGHSSHLMHIGLDGTITRITKAEGAVLELAAAGDKLFITAMRGQSGPEVYAIDVEGNETRLTDLNTQTAAEYAFSTPQALQFAGSEQDTLEGWVLPPAGFDATRQYPGVLMVHGGPKMAYGTTLCHEMQYLAAQGFAVLFCNPTGSEGRGDEFADIRGRWGLVDYEDLMAFVDTALEACPWLDSARLAVSGGSYGGHVVNWIIGHTTRFAAAVSQRGISNWLSFAGTSDIGPEFSAEQTGNTPFEDGPALWEQSPLRWAARATTPTLFIHGEQDRRCPPGESLQMYTALLQHGVEARCVLFPGEGHSLATGKPRARLRRLAEIAAWLHRYLDPPAEALDAGQEGPAADAPPPKPALASTSLFELQSELYRKK